MQLKPIWCRYKKSFHLSVNQLKIDAIYIVNPYNLSKDG